MDDGFAEFLAWEKTTRDTVDFKRIYVDMAGDLVAGLMLSQLVYWCLLPNERGECKLRVYRDGHHWVAKNRNDWRDEIRISLKQADRAIRILVDAGLVVKENSLFDGKRTTHLRIDWDTFRDAWRDNLPEVKPDTKLGGGIGAGQRGASVLTKEPHRHSPKGNIGIDQRATPITKTIAKPTAEPTAETAAASSVTCSIHNAEMQLRTKDGDQWYSHRSSGGRWCKGAPGDQPGDGNGRNHQRDNGTATAICPSCSLVRAVEYICPDCEQCWDCCTCA
ncbi:MAG: hypothetical protein SWK90_14325 [Chloroflexota bacterium]|nr:hypothetical protein [Chloroflexota bacterium]